MADIKQAAKWMQEGKNITRRGGRRGEETEFDIPYAHPRFVHTLHGDEDGRICSEDGLPVSLLLSALLADDWEIAE